MDNKQEVPYSGRIERTRRNIVAMGGIAASALFASLASATKARAAEVLIEQLVINGDTIDVYNDGKTDNITVTGNINEQIGPFPENDKIAITPLGNTGVEIQVSAPACFLKGTKIRTVEGERNIEDLKIGDLLPTVSGGVAPIQWVGGRRYRRSSASKPWQKNVRPIRIAKSAIAPNVPSRDLDVSAGHAIYVDGLLIQAGNLINGMTITRLDASEQSEIEYFNIKLAKHNVIFAEGLPCETLLSVNEAMSNFAEYYRMYGIPQVEETRCAPYIDYRGVRSEIPSRVRSALAPWADRRQKVDIIRDRFEERAIARRETASI